MENTNKEQDKVVRDERGRDVSKFTEAGKASQGSPEDQKKFDEIAEALVKSLNSQEE
jgi:hypothetical protein